jgi:hypothetical protein
MKMTGSSLKRAKTLSMQMFYSRGLLLMMKRDLSRKNL